MATAGYRIGIVGATGALGSELLELLASASIPIREIVPLGTERSLGSDIDFQGESYPVETDAACLAGVDLLFQCAPLPDSLEYVRLALEEKIPCLELSGALSGSAQAPTRVACYGGVTKDMPLIVVPTGPSLAFAMVLQPWVAVGLKRVVATALESAASAGREAIETLYGESVALFGQQDAPELSVFSRPVAFDCLPGHGAIDDEGCWARERRLIQDLSRLLGDVQIAVTLVQVPTFVGVGASLAVEFERPVDVDRMAELLDKAPGVERWDGDEPGPTTRNVSGRDVAVVGRLRADRSNRHGLLLWFAADPLRMAASHAVQLAAMRLA